MEYCPNCKAEVIPENIIYTQAVTEHCNVNLIDGRYMVPKVFDRDGYDYETPKFWCKLCNTELPYSFEEMESWLKKNHSLDKHLKQA